jgi:hypothetical protein
MVARGSAVGSGTALQVGRLRVRLEFFIDMNLSAAIMALGSTQRLKK